MGKSEIPIFSEISHNSVIYARFPKSACITSYRHGKSLVVTSLYQHRSISTFKKFSLWENLRFLYFPTFSIILSFSSDMTIIDLSTQDFEKIWSVMDPKKKKMSQELVLNPSYKVQWCSGTLLTFPKKSWKMLFIYFVVVVVDLQFPSFNIVGKTFYLVKTFYLEQTPFHNIFTFFIR